jgi:hypothetical protein
MQIREAYEQDRERSRRLHAAKRELDVMKGILATKGSPYAKDLNDELAKSEVSTIMREADTYRVRRKETNKTVMFGRKVLQSAMDAGDLEIMQLRQQKVLLEEQEKRLRAFLDIQKHSGAAKPDNTYERLEIKRQREAELAERHRRQLEHVRIQEFHARNIAKLRAGLDPDPLPEEYYSLPYPSEMPSEFQDVTNDGPHREGSHVTFVNSLSGSTSLDNVGTSSPLYRGTPAIPPPHATGVLSQPRSNTQSGAPSARASAEAPTTAPMHQVYMPPMYAGPQFHSPNGDGFLVRPDMHPGGMPPMYPAYYFPGPPVPSGEYTAASMPPSFPPFPDPAAYASMFPPGSFPMGYPMPMAGYAIPPGAFPSELGPHPSDMHMYGIPAQEVAAAPSSPSRSVDASSPPPHAQST